MLVPKVPVIRRIVKDPSAQVSWSKVALAPAPEKPTVTYPIFWQIAYGTTDPKWLEILENFYHGKFLSKFTCSGNTLKYRKDKKSFSCVLDENTPHESFLAFRTFVNKHSGIVSQQEIEEYERQAEIDGEIMAEKTWTDHTQIMKNCMLEAFFDRSAQAAELNSKEKQQLRSLINYALMFGYLRNQIIVENAQIQYISGLYFDTNTRQFRLDENLKPHYTATPKKKSSAAKGTVHFDKIWSKVCEHYPNLQGA